MSTVFVACAGGAAAWWLARRAARLRVLDRVPRRLDRRRAFPEPYRTRLAVRLADAGFRVAPEEAVQVWLLAAASAALMCLPLGPLFVGAAPLAVLAGGPAFLAARARSRARLAAAAVPAVLDGVASELRAGGTVASGLARVGEEGGPLAADLARLEARVGLGASLPEALREMVHERPVAGVPAAAGALALAHEVGGRAANALEGLATSLRERLGVVAEMRALSAQGRASALVVGLGPVAYLGFSALTDPRALRSLVEHPLGRACAAAGILLELAGAWWMRRILSRAEPA